MELLIGDSQKMQLLLPSLSGGGAPEFRLDLGLPRLRQLVIEESPTQVVVEVLDRTIELDEGPRLVSDLLEVEPESIAIGQRVEVYFEELPGQGRMPRFRVVR